MSDPSATPSWGSVVARTTNARDPARHHGRPAEGDRGRPSVLVAFAGDEAAPSTLPSELRARGADVVALDTRIGGETTT
eukprot:1554579-Pleurochrysis_carterae.AAC.1